MSKSKILTGSCLCGAIEYSIDQQPSEFYFCHCEQCQKVTGSSFAANIIAEPKSISWRTGEALLTHFVHPSRDFSKTFCSLCGSGLPHISKSKTSLLIPAGSLDEQPEAKPNANLFIDESPSWLAKGLSAKNFKAFLSDS